ncbi:MAG: sulfur carrier protein ThiS [Alphaproteobacteria bacterium]|nr:sulfur carrier protein ThiS [Alphaproteobacteria bacterium]
MRIRINGKEQELSRPLTVAELLEQLGLDRRKVAVERNLEIVPRSVHDRTALADGDRLEIVSFVGGG